MPFSVAIEKLRWPSYLASCSSLLEPQPTPGNEADAHQCLTGKFWCCEINGKSDPMADKSNNLQDVFLNAVRKTKTPVTMFLINGVKLQGIITWFDNFSVLLRRDGQSQLVYKHAISTVMPATPVQLFDGEKDESDND